MRPQLNSLGILPLSLLLAGSTANAQENADPEAARDRGKIALLPMTCERGVPAEICKVLGDSIALSIAKAPGLEPVTPGDLEMMMGAQALSQLSSCGGDACFVGDEALRIDAAWLLGGTITRLGDNTRAVMRLVDLQRGAVIDRGEVTVAALDEEALDRAVRRLSLKMLSRRGLLTMPDDEQRLNALAMEEEPPPLLLYAGVATAALGVVGLASAGALGGLAYIDVESARAAAALGTNDALALHARDARTKAWGADVLLATGGVLLVGGLVLAVAGAL